MSNLVDSPDVDESDPNAPDIKSAAEHIHDVSSARTARSQPRNPALSGAEERAELPSVSTQKVKRYKCDLERLDGGLCHMSFHGRPELNTHQMTSKHMSPLPCPFCPSATRLRHPQRLFNHVKKWHMLRAWTDFPCQLCASTPVFRSYKSLVSHVTQEHLGCPLEARYRATRGF